MTPDADPSVDEGAGEGGADRTGPEAVRPDGGVATVTPAAFGERFGGEGGPSVWRQVWVVAAQEYRLAIRNRWAFALTGLFGLLAVLLVAFAGSAVGPSRVDAVVVSLAQLATYLVPLAALAFGYDAVVGAEEAGWLDVVFALPTPRSRVVVGTYLGRAGTLAAAIAVGFGAAGGLLAALGGSGAVGTFVTAMVGAIGLGLAFLALAVLVSTLAAEKTHALGASLALWVWFVLIHDLVALGVVAGFAVPDAVLSAFVLANPVDVFRVLVLAAVETTGGGMTAVFATSGLSAPVLVAALVAWCVFPVVAASRLVTRRSV